MNRRKQEVPEAVYKKVISLGEVGYNWLEDLDELIESIERDWNIKVGKALSGGSEAFVAEAVDKNNVDVILKIAMPIMAGGTVFENELTALRLANGNGYARLLRYDMNRRALLLERLGPTLKSLNLPINEQIKILCGALKRTWVPISDETQMTNVDDLFKGYIEFILDLHKNIEVQISQNTIQMAVHVCETRAFAFNSDTAVLVHGDAHNNNLLQVLSIRDPDNQQFKFIDPDGLICEPAYDLGVLMREWIDEISEDPISNGKKRCEYIRSLTNVESEAIWQWGFIQCVSTGLLLIKIGKEKEGMKLLKVADSWANYFIRQNVK